MNSKKTEARIKIWELDRNGEHSYSSDRQHDFYRRSIKTKGKFLTFKTTDGESIAYNMDSIFKYEIEPVE